MTEDALDNTSMVMQYEHVLQGVNKEFQKLLNRNQEMEDEISMSEIVKSKTTWELYETQDQLESEKVAHQRRMKIISDERRDYERTNEELWMKMRDALAENNWMKERVLEMEHQVRSHQNTALQCWESETLMRKKLNDSVQLVTMKDAVIW